jgi:two-component system response regulator AtoC
MSIGFCRVYWAHFYAATRRAPPPSREIPTPTCLARFNGALIPPFDSVLTPMEARRDQLPFDRVTSVSRSRSGQTPSQVWLRANETLRSRRDAALARNVSGAALLESRGMADALDTAKRLARGIGTPILVQGERGSCLVELAQFIHESDVTSRHAQFRAMPGHFVDQQPPMPKHRGGTLFIEDVETLTLNGQRWLTRILTAPSASEPSLRVIAASQMSVGELWQHSSLHQELILMLDVGRVVVPPLRDRPDDIVELADRFLSRCAAASARPGLRFSKEADAALRAYPYPGNVRELRSVVERAVALESNDEIQEAAIVFHEDVASRPRARGSAQAAARRIVVDRHLQRIPTLSEVEREYLVMLVRELRGHRKEISRAMGVSYTTVLKKIAAHGIEIREVIEGMTA